MLRSQLDLVQIIANGGSLELNVGSFSQQDLVQLAANLRRHSNAKIIMRNVGLKSTADLVQIAANAPGQVIFVLDD
jgi:hypothetical protein